MKAKALKGFALLTHNSEYLPSDLVRSLTLIGKLDESYLSLTDTIHDLTSTYGRLPTLEPGKRPKAQDLRREISTKLDYALSAREAAYAEASRLYDEVERHYKRLDSVAKKLRALPKPPSRDPSPVQQAQNARSRTEKKEEITTTQPRLTLRLGTANRHRQKKTIVPGEVLPPPNPDSPLFPESEWESLSPSPVPMPTSRVGAPSRSRSLKPSRIRPPKPPKAPKPKVPKAARPPRPPRPPGAMGTNVHSAVAGISTSNALSLLTPPPPDPIIGGVHAPWFRLTEWEMARLRKRMKKNAIWTPSETMIRRELSEAGRGPDNYKLARKAAEDAGTEFIDYYDAANTDPNRPLVPGEISADIHGPSDKISNKGMKLNEAKKRKKIEQAQEQAALKAAEEANPGSTILSKLASAQSEPTEELNGNINVASNKGKVKDKSASHTSKKRKREATPAEDHQAKSEIVLSPPQSKKRTTVPPALNSTSITTTIPLASAAPSPKKAPTPAPQPTSPSTTRKAAATSTRSRRPSLPIKASVQIPEQAQTQAVSRPPSRSSSRRASAGPPVVEPVGREHLRRKSATPAPPPPTVTAASRRSKRPAPGIVTNSQDGGAAVSVGKRKNAPRKRGTAAAANAAKKAAEGNIKEKEEEVKAAAEEVVVDDIDPDEPRYCLCGDVSYGTMILCENTDVSILSIQLVMRFEKSLLIWSIVRKGVVPSRVHRPTRTSRTTSQMVLSRLQGQAGQEMMAFSAWS